MKFSDVIGNDNVKQILKKAVATGSYAHTYLFYGPDGSGTEDMAFAFAQALLCDNFTKYEDACGECKYCHLMEKNAYPDLYILEPTLKLQKAKESKESTEQDEAQKMGKKQEKEEKDKKKQPKQQFIRVEQIRQLQEKLSLKPYYPKKKIVIVKAADKMNLSAANAFLKTLEEPPGDTVIILLTDKREALLPTILSRCQQFAFTKPSRDEMYNWLEAHIDSSNKEEIAKKYMLYSDFNPKYVRIFESPEAYIEFAEKIFRHLLTIITENDKIIRNVLRFASIDAFFDKIKKKDTEKKDTKEKEQEKEIPLNEKLSLFLDMVAVFLNSALVSAFEFPGIERVRRLPRDAVISVLEYVEELRQMLVYNVSEDLVLINLFIKISELGRINV